MELSERASHAGGDIAKLVFTPKNNQAVLRILDASNSLVARKKLFTVFGMGDIAQITRLATLLLGGSLIYCSLGKTDRKLGQIDVRYSKKFLKFMKSYGMSNIRKDRRTFMREIEAELEKGKRLDYDFVLGMLGKK